MDLDDEVEEQDQQQGPEQDPDPEEDQEQMIEEVQEDQGQDETVDVEEIDEVLVPFSPGSPSTIDTPPPAITLYNRGVVADRLRDLNPADVYNKWLSDFDAGQLNEEGMLKMLKEYWHKLIPHVYRLNTHQSCTAPFRESAETVEKYLIDPLAYFLSGGKCGADDIQQYLSSSDVPATLCGRVFQVGEATYSCRECGMDPTCVLCVDCFKNSEHKNHKYLINMDNIDYRYKIATSAGGGYCDCGDPEAWKNSVYCELHEPKSVTQQENTVDKELFEKRAALLLPALLLYSFELTANELDRHLPAAIALEDEETDKLGSNLFCTVLYNDETHTFDLVIQTLTRALQCSKKDAMEFATTIDREGRSIVKVGNFPPCHEAQKIIERSTAGRGPHTKSLKCSVMKKDVVQHQSFALRLLSWLESICINSVSVRKVIQNVFYCRGDGLLLCAETKNASWLVESILLNDTKLWKAARSCWHRLIIAGLLKEGDSKKTFAEVFTRQYAMIMDDFIRDDHDHSYSVTSLSVQIFTVPSIAQFLVEEQDVIYTILRVLLAQCDSRVNANGKLEFDRSAVIATATFKRTNYAILDLKYILTNPPSQWSAVMVKNFTHGIDSFLKFLSYMQEMDSVTRQVGQHMEYEPEWESAFNLHIKLQPVVQLSLEWCGLNKPVFIRAFRHCLHDLSKAYESLKSKTVILELANHSATCYSYEVATQPVSVHLPLTRYFAGLYLHLEKYKLDFFSTEFNLLQTEKPVPEMIMEPALRAQVLVAQANASMWKRNGYALLNQLYFYHNVRCRADMLDKDIVTLQIASSVIESNEFLLHMLNRFGLYQWVSTGFDDQALKPEGQEEDFSKYLGTLTEEFLGLLITLVSARFTPGVGQVSKAEAIKKEVIQQLCVESMTHSMLNKSLVENVNLETGLESVVHDVANQRGPTPQRTSVVYELKPEFYECYDVYHYHYTREEMSKAEENQRGRKKAAKEPEIFPPPKLPPFTAMFDMLINILQCDVFLHIIALVLNKSLLKTVRSINESLLRKTLHLIGLGLNEEIVRNQKEAEQFFQFSHNAQRYNIFELLDKMLQDQTLSHHHSMILWLRKQHTAIKPEMGTLDEPMIVQPDEEEQKRKKAEMVREAKEKMMAKMAAAQKKFMMVNKDLFTEDVMNESDETFDIKDTEMQAVETVVLGPSQQCPSHIPDEKYICILCQEEQSLTVGSKRFVLACFIQRSTVMSQYREKLLEASTVEYKCHCEKLQNGHNPLFLNPDLNHASIMSSCGHIMHDHCWSSHMDTVVNKERRRPYRLRHPLSFDVDKLEWLCPMCDSICNAALPMTVHLSKMYPTPKFSWLPGKERPTSYDNDVSKSFSVWMQGMQIVLQHKQPSTKMPTTGLMESWAEEKWAQLDEDVTYHMLSEPVPKILKELTEEDAAIHFAQLYPARVFKDNPTHRWLQSGFHSSFTTFMSRNYIAVLNTDEPSEDDFRMLLYMWHCLSYTIISSEAYHRDQHLPFFGPDVPLRRSIGIKYLTRACAVSCDRQEFWAEYIRTFAIRLLSTLINNRQSDPTLFECDAFAIVVSLTFAMSALFVYNDPFRRATNPDPKSHGDLDLVCIPPSGSRVDHHILRLVYMYHVTQILLSNDFSHCIKETEVGSSRADVLTEESMDTSESEVDPEASADAPPRFVPRKEYIFGKIWQKARKGDIPWGEMSRIDCEAVWRSVQEASVPFLRCCAKFYESLTGISPPPDLETVNCSFDALIKYLDLPKEFEALFVSPLDWQIPYKWTSHPQTAKLLEVYLPPDAREYPIQLAEGVYKFLPPIVPVKYPRTMPMLTKLSDDYTDLINMVSNFICKNSKTLDSRVPTMCLICGTVLCSQSYCCQRELKPGASSIGACIQHAAFCGGGSGLFLRIRECKLFLTHGLNRGCYMPPPFLDEYGEPDQGLRRGNPLKLSKEKYESFRKLWVQHAIPEEIARTTEHSVTLTATDWQNL